MNTTRNLITIYDDKQLWIILGGIVLCGLFTTLVLAMAVGIVYF